MRFHSSSHCILGPSGRGKGSELARGLSKALGAPLGLGLAVTPGSARSGVFIYSVREK